MGDWIFKDVMKESLEASYRSELKGYRVVNFEIGSMMAGLAFVTVMASPNFMKGTHDVDLKINKKFYKSFVSNTLTIDGTNSPLFQFMSGAAELHYQQFLNSFESHFANEGESDIYRYSFEKLAKSLSNMQYKKAYVDVDKKAMRLDFYLNVGNKMLLTVSQVSKDIDDNMVMFSLEHNHETIVMDRINLQELINKIQNIQMSLRQA